jgi:hypothetical protein
MTFRNLAFALTFVASSATLAAAPNTLIVKQPDGKLAPGAAKSWTTGKDSVSFVLADGVDGAAIAKLLTERLASGKVTFAAGKLDVTGVAPAALLDQLSAMSLSGEGGDPLADLAGLGTVVAMDTPEGGGSIRASKPAGGSARPRIIKDHDAAERVVAKVVEVQRGAFPTVTLKLEVKKGAKAGALKDRLKKGSVIAAQVVLASKDGSSIDLASNASQRNVGAYYLVPGDSVSAHLIPGDGDAIELDFVERATP